MKEHELMIHLAKIIERHPEIYDSRLEAYKTRLADVAWENVAASVRSELKEEYTVEELKIRWKGIRSSFNRYKNKLLNNSDSCKKYYLYDTLKFLDPFTRPKGIQTKEVINYDDNSKELDDNNSGDHWKIKTDIIPKETDQLVQQRLSNENTNCYTHSEHAKKRKYSSEDKVIEDENEDLQFFKSILPDIKDFTNKEKRKLKIGILRLIDDLENERKQQ